MLVPGPDLAPDFGAGPCAGPKIYEILKFDELWIFSVFSNVNDISDDFCWFGGEKMKIWMILVCFVEC